MSFQDRSQANVKNLLALLRSTQDPSAAAPSLGQTRSFAPAHDAALPHAPASSRAGLQAHYTPPRSNEEPALPSQSQLDELLASLNQRPHPSPTKGPRDALIPAFGPVGQDAGPAIRPFDPQEGAHTFKGAVTQPVRETERGSANVDDMGFGKALPIIGQLLSDDKFKMEIKKMKADQDALERRLWAKGERIKAEHNERVKAERDIARIARRPLTQEKISEWSAQLDHAMQEFYRTHCLPSIDGLAVRQQQKLKDLGVPGLGSGQYDPKSKERVKRIMDVLEAGLED